ncbi:hypothetical protein [Streptomyces hokutonensis]
MPVHGSGPIRLRHLAVALTLSAALPSPPGRKAAGGRAMSYDEGPGPS